MARRNKKPAAPWLTGKAYRWNANKPMPPWIKLDLTLLQDRAFGQLTPSARLLYLAMALHGGDRADEWFTFTLTTAEKYNLPRSTLQKGVKDLCDAGFLEARRPGTEDKWAIATYAPTMYRLTPTDWKNRPDPKPQKRTRAKKEKSQ